MIDVPSHKPTPPACHLEAQAVREFLEAVGNLRGLDDVPNGLRIKCLVLQAFEYGLHEGQRIAVARHCQAGMN